MQHVCHQANQHYGTVGGRRKARRGAARRGKARPGQARQAGWLDERRVWHVVDRAEQVSATPTHRPVVDSKANAGHDRDTMCNTSRPVNPPVRDEVAKGSRNGEARCAMSDSCCVLHETLGGLRLRVTHTQQARSRNSHQPCETGRTLTRSIAHTQQARSHFELLQQQKY